MTRAEAAVVLAHFRSVRHRVKQQRPPGPRAAARQFFTLARRSLKGDILL